MASSGSRNPPSPNGKAGWISRSSRPEGRGPIFGGLMARVLPAGASSSSSSSALLASSSFAEAMTRGVGALAAFWMSAAGAVTRAGRPRNIDSQTAVRLDRARTQATRRLGTGALAASRGRASRFIRPSPIMPPKPADKGQVAGGGGAAATPVRAQTPTAASRILQPSRLGFRGARPSIRRAPPPCTSNTATAHAPTPRNCSTMSARSAPRGPRALAVGPGPTASKLGSEAR